MNSNEVVFTFLICILLFLTFNYCNNRLSNEHFYNPKLKFAQKIKPINPN